MSVTNWPTRFINVNGQRIDTRNLAGVGGAGGSTAARSATPAAPATRAMPARSMGMIARSGGFAGGPAFGSTRSMGTQPQRQAFNVMGTRVGTRFPAGTAQQRQPFNIMSMRTGGGTAPQMTRFSGMAGRSTQPTLQQRFGRFGGMRGVR